MSDFNNDKINSSSSSTTADVTSSLPEEVLEKLRYLMVNQYSDNSLYFKPWTINDDMVPELCEWIIKLRDKIKLLLLGISLMTSTGISLLLDTLRTKELKITHIGLAQTRHFDDSCMKSVGEYIRANKFIDSMCLDNNYITDAGADVLIPYLDGNTTFKGLFLQYNNKITDNSIPSILKIIESSRIEYIHIGGTSISKKSIFAVSLTRNVLRYGGDELALFDKDINDDDMANICEVMKAYGVHKLHRMDFQSNCMTSKGISLLCKTLKECNSTASFLILSKNNFDDECLKYVGEFIEDNQYLKMLHLAESGLTDKGVEILCDYIIGNTILVQLHLNSSIKITDASVPYIVNAIKKSYLDQVEIFGTSVTQEKAYDIKSAEYISAEKREIPIKSNTKPARKSS